MNIQTPPSVTRHVMEFIYVNEAKGLKPICIIEAPSAQPVPNVGDEISIPKGMEKTLGTEKTIFKIIKRRFPLVVNGLAQTKVVFFVSSEIG